MKKAWPRKNPAKRRAITCAIVIFIIVGIIIPLQWRHEQAWTPPKISSGVMRNLKASAVQAKPDAPSGPLIVTRQVTETSEEPYTVTTRDDPSFDSGTTTIVTHGIPGVRTITYSISTIDGVEQPRVFVSNSVTTPPVNEVVLRGTKLGTTCEPTAATSCQ